MVWLRYELWENHDDLGYRLANKAETDRLKAASPEGHLRNVFYAPSPAAAEAQYCALRGIGPYIVNPADSEEPFTMAQLESQLADFPDDERLARQPALPQADGRSAVAALGHKAEEPDSEHHHETASTHPVEHHEHADPHPHDDHGHAETAQADTHHAPDHSHDHAAPSAVELATPHHEPNSHPHDHHAQAHAETVESHPHPADDHTHDHDADAGPVAFPAAHHEAEPTPHVDRPLAPTPKVTSAEIDALGPVTLAAAEAPIPTIKRRKPNAILGFLRLVVRLVMLAIVLGAVTVGVGIATGNLNAQTLLAQARELPAQIRELSILRNLVP